MLPRFGVRLAAQERQAGYGLKVQVRLYRRSIQWALQDQPPLVRTRVAEHGGRAVRGDQCKATFRSSHCSDVLPMAHRWVRRTLRKDRLDLSSKQTIQSPAGERSTFSRRQICTKGTAKSDRIVETGRRLAAKVIQADQIVAAPAGSYKNVGARRPIPPVLFYEKFIKTAFC